MIRATAVALIAALGFAGWAGAAESQYIQERTIEEGNHFLCMPWGCIGGSLMAGLADWRSTAEGTYASNFGWTLGLDAASPIPYLQDYGLGVQFAGSFGQYDLNGRASAAPPDPYQHQHFYSIGMFRRPDPYGLWWDRWGAGFAYDISLNEDAGEQADSFYIRQWRWKTSYEITPSHEVGLWGAIAGPTASAGSPEGSPVPVDQFRALNQFNFFYKHRFEQGGSLMLYWGPGIGGALPLTAIGNPYYGLKWTAGGEAVAPLSKYLAFFADAAYGDPDTPGVRGFSASSTQSYSMLAGLRFYWGANARGRDDDGRRWMPYISDTDNGNFFTQSNFSY